MAGSNSIKLIPRELPLLAPRPPPSSAVAPSPILSPSQSVAPSPSNSTSSAESSTSSTQPKPSSMKQYYTPPVKVALPKRKQYESPKGKDIGIISVKITELKHVIPV